jgi:hypothetical protein
VKVKLDENVGLFPARRKKIRLLGSTKMSEPEKKQKRAGLFHYFFTILFLIAYVGSGSLSYAEKRRISKKQWAISVGALIAASILDTSSSMGKYEQNALLQDPAGKFSTGKGVAIKSGFVAGTVVSQIIMMKKRPKEEIYPSATYINFISAGILGGVAIRNFQIPKPEPVKF